MTTWNCESHEPFLPPCCFKYHSNGEEHGDFPPRDAHFYIIMSHQPPWDMRVPLYPCQGLDLVGRCLRLPAFLFTNIFLLLFPTLIFKDPQDLTLYLTLLPCCRVLHLTEAQWGEKRQAAFPDRKRYSRKIRPLRTSQTCILWDSRPVPLSQNSRVNSPGDSEGTQVRATARG